MSFRPADAIALVLPIALSVLALSTIAFAKGKPDFPSGTISVDCRGGRTVYRYGKIFIDGSEVGRCPHARREVSTGVHTVRVGEARANGEYLAYENERVVVRKDRNQNLIANLTLVSAEKAAGLAYALGATQMEIDHLNRPEHSEVDVLSPDGTILAAGAETNSVRLYDATNGKSLGRLGAMGEYWVSSVTELQFSADGSLLASNGWLRDQYQGVINIWNMRTRQPLRTILNLKEVYSLAFSPDGKLLAAGVGINEVRVWNVTSGTLLWSARPPGRADAKISQLFFSDDGSLLVTGPNYGENISVYDVSTAKHMATLRGNLVMPGKSGTVFTFSYHGQDRTLRSAWRLPSGELISSNLLNSSAVRAMNEQVALAGSGAVSLDSRNERFMKALNEPAQIVLTPDHERWQVRTHLKVLTLPASPGMGENRATQEVPSVRFCELVKNPKAYFDQRVRLIAKYQMATEAAYLDDDQCPRSHNQSIGVGRAAELDDQQREILGAELRKISTSDYGGRAIVTVVGTLRNSSRRDFAWYQYRFDIESVVSVSPVIVSYEGELQAVFTYRAKVRGGDGGPALLPQPKQLEHYAMHIEWVNLQEFPELNKPGEHLILFTVFSDEIKQITERRWNRSLRCRILRVD